MEAGYETPTVKTLVKTKSLVLLQLMYHTAILEGPPQNTTWPRVLNIFPNIFCYKKLTPG